MREKVCGIYLITNKVNGKQYVGQSVNCLSRWNNHCGKKSVNMVVGRAIQKYGVENFRFEVLVRCSRGDLNALERFYINNLGTQIPNGYNVDKGGKTTERTEDIKHRISASMLGMAKTKEHKENAKKALIASRNRIYQIYKDGELVTEVDNLTGWCKDNNYSVQNFFKVLKGERKTALGYFVKLKDG